MRHPKGYDTTPETSRRMSRVKLKGGTAEGLLAKALWHAGVRYRRNDRRLPGSPDIAIGRDKIAVFVDGEFWHGYDWERRKERLVRNRAYWLEKIQENIDRDRRDDGRLRALGWTPVRFWEREVKADPAGCAGAVLALILERRIQARELLEEDQEDAPEDEEEDPEEAPEGLEEGPAGGGAEDG